VAGLVAGGWGLLAGSALLAGAVVGWLADLPKWLVATVMAFGAGVLISAVSFELIDEAWRTGGLWATAGGACAGAVTFAAADALLTRMGRGRRKGMTAQAGGGSGFAAGVGLAVAELVRPEVLAGVTGVAAGAVLAMEADTMIPEAYEIDRAATGLFTVLGFLAAFALSKAA
jgi:zinc transporter, ZIP family